MLSDKFELPLKSLHFSNNEKLHTNRDRVAKLNPLSILLQARLKSVYMPISIITTDETAVPWQGRLFFRQYIPGKVHKYGVKMY